MTARAPILACLAAVSGCTRPAESRALAELEVGRASISDARVEIADALAAVRKLGDLELELWAQSPTLELTLALGATATGIWNITAKNVLPDAVLVVGGVVYTRAPGDHPTVARFAVPLADGDHAISIAPPDAATTGTYRIAALADIQTALPVIDEMFETISAIPDLRFVVGMGDITERAEQAEYDLFDRQLAALSVPYYTTLGNHELWEPAERFFERYGRASFSFRYRGVVYTFADSGDAAIDPIVEDWVQGWLDAGRDATHVFLTHFPPIDPVGVRYGAMRSTRDGHRLIGRLVEGDVDLTLYGHIHTYVAYENAGIPAYISGGGGAQPQVELDGLDRHFLVIDLGPAGVGPVVLHRLE